VLQEARFVLQNKDFPISMAKKKRRRPGGGRKPGELGLKSATLSLWLPPDMRAALAAAATRNKRRSVSEEIVLRLRSTLVRDRGETDQPRHIRDMLDVVAWIALGLENRTELPWNEDRYTQEQLSKGIDSFLYTYSRGKAVVPPAVRAEAARNPEDTFFIERLGELVAGGIISWLRLPRKPPEMEEEIRLMKQGNPPIYYPPDWRHRWEIDQNLRGSTDKSLRRKKK
jgi:hypothetical protein